MAFNLYAPAAYGAAQTASGATYTGDSNGLVTGVPIADVKSLLEAGWTISATQPAATITVITAATAAITTATTTTENVTTLNATTATVTGLLSGSSATTLTAAGTNQATALQLTKNISNITTVGSGTEYLVINSGANTLAIYTNGAETIDGGSGATGVTLTAAHRAAKFYAVSATACISALLGAVST